ncbi:VWA domain-containing protein [Ectopseudomonas mendocina]|uniref:VWA domain-containing protein n=1 Tax=Ectopseudomonas mendocina TaxID=300 RepID=A0ABD7RZG1_ECTME|nr:VWA domain-containing protein [Pseudomonas mendocina]TRO18736.1 VWA domain-containing protein [Pseudomonas mendocina]
MGRAAGAAPGNGRTARAAALAKKVLSIRPRTATGADARTRPGRLGGGLRGAARSGVAGRIDWAATLRQGRPQRREQLVLRPRSQQADELWLVLVDASASTRRHGALSLAKGVLAELFDRAYRQRARLAVLQAGGREAQWLWQGRKASAELHRWLHELGAGGGTPLLDALNQAGDWLLRRQRAKPHERQRLLILTDGRLRDLPALAPLPCPTLLLDTERAPIRLGRARQLAQALQAEYHHIDDLAPGVPGRTWRTP